MENAGILSGFLDNEHEESSHCTEGGVDLRSDVGFMALRQEFDFIDVFVRKVEFVGESLDYEGFCLALTETVLFRFC